MEGRDKEIEWKYENTRQSEDISLHTEECRIEQSPGEGVVRGQRLAGGATIDQCTLICKKQGKQRHH